MSTLNFAAKDNETAQQDPAPIPHVLGMVTGVQLKVAKAEWDEATDAAIQQDLEEVYKPKGLAGIQEFVNKFGEFQGYELEAVSIKTADLMMHGQFQTMEELTKYNRDSASVRDTMIYILFRKEPNPNGGKELTIIETIIINE